MNEFKSVRATVNDPELIELIEEATYQSELSEQDLVIEGLYHVFGDDLEEPSWID